MVKFAKIFAVIAALLAAASLAVSLIVAYSANKGGEVLIVGSLYKIDNSSLQVLTKTSVQTASFSDSTAFFTVTVDHEGQTIGSRVPINREDFARTENGASIIVKGTTTPKGNVKAKEVFVVIFKSSPVPDNEGSQPRESLPKRNLPSAPPL